MSELCKAEVFLDTCHTSCYRPKSNIRSLASRYKAGKLPGELVELYFVSCPCGCGGYVVTEAIKFSV